MARGLVLNEMRYKQSGKQDGKDNVVFINGNLFLHVGSLKDQKEGKYYE